MANDERILLGLRPTRQPFGAVQVNYYRANTAINMFRYQPVILNNSGQVQVAAIADLSGILGVTVGFLDANKAALPGGMDRLADSSTTGPFLPSGNDAYVAVADNPDQWFVVESDTGGAAIGSVQSIGQTIDFVYLTGLTTNGNTTTGIANVLLDSSTTGNNTGGVLTLVALADMVNQDGTLNTAANFGKWIVKINAHQNAADKRNMAVPGLVG